MLSLFKRKNPVAATHWTDAADKLSSKGFQFYCEGFPSWLRGDWKSIEPLLELLNWTEWRDYLASKGFAVQQDISISTPRLQAWRSDGIIHSSITVEPGGRWYLVTQIPLKDVLFGILGFVYYFNPGYCGRSWVPGAAYLRREVSGEATMSPPKSPIDDALASFLPEARAVIGICSSIDGNRKPEG